MRAKVLPRQLLVLMDFTSTYLTPKIGHSNNHSVVQDCIVVLEYMSNGQRMRENINFLCDCQESNKNDYHFVIPHIDRDPALKPDPIPLVHIKRQHRFDYENGLCYCAELSDGAMKKLFSFQLR